MESVHRVAVGGAQAGRVRFWKIAVAVLLLAGAVALLVFGNQEPFVYSKSVDEIITHTTQLSGQKLRAEGLLVPGSIRFREQPCEWRFSIQGSQPTRTLPVVFSQCVVPDTFRDGMGISVVVEGQVATGPSFTATQVIPRCPSKYEMRERQQRGEQMPHAAATPPSV